MVVHGDASTSRNLSRSAWSTPVICAVVALLAVITYIPTLFQPLISDDYLQIAEGRKYGGFSQFWDLAKDPLYRCRAVSIWLTRITEELFGINPSTLYATAILFHAVNSCLVFFFGLTMGMDRRLSAIAAAFFAIYIGHQEAVMWYGAFHELTLLFFCLLFLILWQRWLDGKAPLLAAYLCFVLALLSKEPAVVLVPLALLLRLSKRNVLALIPPAIAALVYTIAIFNAKAEHLHLNDGTFSLRAPFWITWSNSFGRMLWFETGLGLLAMLAWGTWREHRRTIIYATVFISITLLPFCFLTYMTRIPSRHTYLPSAGLAFLFAAGFLSFQWKTRHIVWSARALAAVILIHQIGYIWIKKRDQFLVRAEPTEQLLRIARETPGPIKVTCFPYGREVADEAVRIILNRDPNQSLEWKVPVGATCRTLEVAPPPPALAGN
jgi:hypothetical protein